MSQLSAQTIIDLCRPSRPFELQRPPMIAPFNPEKVVVRGRSKGLSSASYDVAIAHDVTLGVNPSVIIEQHIRSGLSLHGSDLDLLRDKLTSNPPSQALVCTVEDFHMPDNVVGYVCDKSSYARVFVTAFNTLFDPGFIGNATIELVNMGVVPVFYAAGDPVCQFVFHFLDEATDRPYNGKYQNQPKGPQGPIHEEVYPDSTLGHA